MGDDGWCFSGAVVGFPIIPYLRHVICPENKKKTYTFDGAGLGIWETRGLVLLSV